MLHEFQNVHVIQVQLYLILCDDFVTHGMIRDKKKHERYVVKSTEKLHF